MPHEVKAELEGDHVGEAESTRGRLIAIAAVLTTLAAATTGYLEAAAVKGHDEAAVKAERLAALAVNVAAANEDQAQAQVERYRTWLDERAQAEAATASAHRLGLPARMEAARWDRVAAATARNTQAIAGRESIKFGCDSGTARCLTKGLAPLCSPTPGGAGCGVRGAGPDVNGYLEAVKLESYRLSAEREAANQDADAAESRFAHLAAALIMLSVAVFLFGYSLTPQGRDRRGLFTSVASCFLVLGLGWAVWHALRGSDHPPVVAAVAFAKGEVALASYDYPTAIAQLSRAVKLAPKSVDAYVDLGEAEYEQANPNGSGTGVSTRDLERIVWHEQKALDNGSESPTARFDLGSILLFLGIKTGNNDAVRRARELSEESASRFVDQVKEGRNPGKFLVEARFTVAEADLALGAPSTRDHYCEAIRQMVGLRNEADLGIPDIRAASHDDIDLITSRRPARRDEGAAILRQLDTAARTRRAPLCPAG